MNPVFRFSRDFDENQVRRPWSVDPGRRRSGRSQHPLLKLSDLSPAEQRAMAGAIRRLACQIHGAKTRSLKRAHRALQEGAREGSVAPDLALAAQGLSHTLAVYFCRQAGLSPPCFAESVVD